jgi:hypothetical protein
MHVTNCTFPLDLLAGNEEAMSFLARTILGVDYRREPAIDWWAYFGSFGDDIFGDD